MTKWLCSNPVQLNKEVADGQFTSSALKYFEIRVNADDITEAGAHGDYYDVIYPAHNGLGSNTIVRVTQYDSNGGIVGITEIDFHDVR